MASATASPSSSSDPPTRKRQCTGHQPLPPEESLDESSMSDEDSSDNEGFTEVLGRRARRLLKAGKRSCSTVKNATGGAALTVLFVPVVPTSSVSKLSKHQLSLFLEGLAPGLVKEARVNAPKNIIAVDAVSSAGVTTLLSTTSLCGLEVRSYRPREKNTLTGVIRDVDVDIPESKLASLISSTATIYQVRRLGTSTCVKIIFHGDCLPATVKVGLVRHQVRPFVPRPLQCRNCMKIGHVAGACTLNVKCGHCGADHKNEECAKDVRCANCLGAHEATSKDCPRLRRELKICQRMARDNSSHKAAANQVRRKSRSRSKAAAARVRQKSRSQSKVKLPQRQAPAQPAAGMTTEEMILPKSFSDALKGSVSKDAPSQRFAAAKSPVKTSQSNSDQDREVHWSETAESPAKISISDSGLDREAHIFAMLKSLISIIRSLINNLKTPAAKAASQILDTIIPVMDCLVSNQ